MLAALVPSQPVLGHDTTMSAVAGVSSARPDPPQSILSDPFYSSRSDFSDPHRDSIAALKEHDARASGRGNDAQSDLRGVSTNFEMQDTPDPLQRRQENTSATSAELADFSSPAASRPKVKDESRSADGEYDEGEEATGPASADANDDLDEAGLQDRKRKRTRKGLDKKYECPHQGCGKSYSRAEHLYRHQLNHTPKQYYYCDFPGCDRHFVRQDLCARHRERHTTHGSNLQRKTNPAISNPVTQTRPGTARLGMVPPQALYHDPFRSPPSGPNLSPDGSSIPGASYNSNPYGLASNPAISPATDPQLLRASSSGSHFADPPPPPAGQDQYLSPPLYNSAPTSASGYGEVQPNGGSPFYVPGSSNLRRASSTRSSNPNTLNEISTPSYGPAQAQGSGHRLVKNEPFDASDPAGVKDESFAMVKAESFNASDHQGIRHGSFAGMKAESPLRSLEALNVQHDVHGINARIDGKRHAFGPMPNTNQPSHFGASAHQPWMPSLAQSGFSEPSALSQNRYGSTPLLEQSNFAESVPAESHASQYFAAATDELAAIMHTDSPQTDNSFASIEGEVLTRSPVHMPADFISYLFAPQGGQVPSYRYRGNREQALLEASMQPLLDGSLPLGAQHTMNIGSILDRDASNAILSEHKRQQLIELLNTFRKTDHGPIAAQRQMLLYGNQDDPSHPLSHQSIKMYIGSYWYHFHDQMPILHKPTFSADKAHPLLLLAIIVLGAANLEKVHGDAVTKAGADLAYFIAWHLRTELFDCTEFQPPGKLWILQTLLLLECYEKLYSSRKMHERAHIHHAATIFLLRRGSALQGWPTQDPFMTSDKSGKDAHGSTAGTIDQWWNRWIMAEATKRVAYAAFIIDSLHATMFAHTAVMLANEMKLPLPCDEALWTAESGQEVARLIDSDKTRKHLTFLEALKSTLANGPVKTNVFGRTALMAGLLNITFHLGQRDQLYKLGMHSQPDQWRGHLTRAFDVWERDWASGPTASSEPLPSASAKAASGSSLRRASNADLSSINDSTPMAPRPATSAGWRPMVRGRTKADDHVYESRVVLHHLAHMGVHISILHCQIYAGATRLLGRPITPGDRRAMQSRMRDLWAPRPSARDSVFFSLKFLLQVLTPDLYDATSSEAGAFGSAHRADKSAGPGSVPHSATSVGPVTLGDGGMQNTTGLNGASSSMSMGSTRDYAPHDDFLLHRPWLLYYAALVVWSYGYALEGPLPPHARRHLTTRAEYVADLRAYMRSVGSVAGPDDLAHITGRNACVGLLCFLRDAFRQCHWELLHEGSALLQNCIDMLQGQPE